MSRLFAISVVVAIFSFPMLSSARDQSLEGAGIQAGVFRLHPTLDVETAYNDNVFRNYRDSRCDSFSTDDPRRNDYACRPTVAATVLRLLPGLTLTNPSESTVQADLDLNMDFRQYVSSDKNVRGQSSIGGELDGRLELGVGRPVALLITQNFIRLLEAGSEPGVTNHNNLMSNRTGANLRFQPGGGMLDMQAGYRFSFREYEHIADDLHFRHRGLLKANWKFLPKTAIIFDGSMEAISYRSKAAPSPSSSPIRASLGLAGLLTNKLSLSIMGGYGNSRHQEGDSYHFMIGQAGAIYRFTEQSRLSLSYSRDFDESIIANYYYWDRASLQFDIQFSPKLSLNLGGNYERRKLSSLYPLSAFSDNLDDYVTPRELPDGRVDNLMVGKISIEWRPREWSRATLGYRITYLHTDAGARIRQYDPATGLLSDEYVKEAQFLQNYPYLTLGVIY